MCVYRLFFKLLYVIFTELNIIVCIYLNRLQFYNIQAFMPLFLSIGTDLYNTSNNFVLFLTFVFWQLKFVNVWMNNFITSYYKHVEILVERLNM